MAKDEELERTYTIPLRREFQKVPRYKRTKKAVTAVKEFLIKHMKAKEVKIGVFLNKELWKNGIKNPPHHVKVTAERDDEGIVRAELVTTPKKKVGKRKIKEKLIAKKTEEPLEDKVAPKEKASPEEKPSIEKKASQEEKPK